MKKLHKILYSFFSFCICGFSIQHADAAQKCGKLILRDDGATDLQADGWRWHLYKDAKPTSPNSSLGVCVNNQCLTISTANFNAACVNYASVYMLSLYEAEFVNYGCTADYAYTATKCIQDSACSTGYSACQSALYHKIGCSAGCAPGFFYDSDASACTQCPTYSIAIAQKDGTVMLSDERASTASCNATSDATINKCYASNVTNGRTKDGHSYTITNGACFYGSY